MNQNINTLIDQIALLPPDWHGAGSVGVNVLRAIARHADSLGGLRSTAETGAGKTTLLFSGISPDHTVFAINAGDSLEKVLRSPLFNAAAVTIVEGPTQATLSKYTFPKMLQLALIDGPHGYPFPDLEYFYLYPQIETGGLLLVDDIQIPTIRNMFNIIKADPMFELLEIVDGNMAFFRRTSAPCIDPMSDSWWLQGYNIPHYRQIMNLDPKPLTRRLVSCLAWAGSKVFPPFLKNLIPARLKQKVFDRM